MTRPAVRMQVDGVDGYWVTADVARRYAAAVDQRLRSIRRRYPVAELPADLLAAQLIIGSADGTKQAPEATNGACSDRVMVPGSPGRCVERLAVAEAARALRVSSRAVRKAIASGRLPATRLGQVWVIEWTDLEIFRRKRDAACQQRVRQ